MASPALTPETSISFASLLPGDPCPWLVQRTPGRAGFKFHTMAGRYLLLCFFLSASDAQGRSAIEAIQRHRDLFDDQFASVFAISIDPADERESRLTDSIPGIRVMWDFDKSVSRICGALSEHDLPGSSTPAAQRFWMLVDPTLHVLAKVPFRADDPEHKAIFAYLKSLPTPDRYGGLQIPAPILVLPNVFERTFCKSLIDAYAQNGGKESGVIRNNAGVLDNNFKRRKDHIVSDEAIIRGAITRIHRRVVPEIEKFFFLKTTRIERHIVGCYAAEDGGHFAPHRDNEPGITEHRRFAVSINLNSDFEGGELTFPECSGYRHKAPAGWAIVFPCALLHCVQPVVQGRRYAYLPFLYDEAGAAIRAANRGHAQNATAGISEEVSPLQKDPYEIETGAVA